MTANDATLCSARIAALERESRRAFDDAQHEADALFAQYQLSQLSRRAASPSELAASVIARARPAGRRGRRSALARAARTARSSTLLASAATAAAGRRAADAARATSTRAGAGAPRRGRACGSSSSATSRPRSLLVLLGRPIGRSLDPDGIRVVQLARHELAVAFRGARLREALERERARADAPSSTARPTSSSRSTTSGGSSGSTRPASGCSGSHRGDALGRTCAEVLGCDVAGGHGEDACPLPRSCATGQPDRLSRDRDPRRPTASSIRVAGGYSRSRRSAPTDGRRSRATAILRDISAVRALEELREGFVATVSHELRTPLALIRGYAETLLHLDLDAGRAARLPRADRRGHRRGCRRSSARSST